MFFSAVKLGILTWGVYGMNSLLQPASNKRRDIEFIIENDSLVNELRLCVLTAAPFENR